MYIYTYKNIHIVLYVYTHAHTHIYMDFPPSSVVKNLTVNAGDTRDVCLIPGSGRSHGGGNGNPLQYSCLEKPMDRKTWQATVHGIEKNQT